MVKRVTVRFRAIVRVTRICADICGADVLDHNFRINWRSVLVFAILVMTSCFMSYTIYMGFVVEGDWKAILQVLSIGGGTLVQGYCKLLNAISKQKDLRFLFNELLSVYEEYELKHSDYRLCLYRGTKILSGIMILSAFIVMLMVMGLIVVTVFFSVVLKKRHMVVQCLVPGLDPTTETGFIWSNIIQIWFIAVGGFGFYAGDMGFFTLISQVPVLKDVIRCKFRDLNGILDEEERDQKRKSLVALRDIIIFHQKYLGFLNLTQDTYFWVILVQIATYSMGIVCTLFSLLLGSWPGGYVYMIYCFVMMNVYCGMGTLIETSNEDLIYSCYNEVRWYDLAIPQKKIVRTMLMMSQNTSGLTVGSMLPLSMHTSMRVTRTIYSIAMMLFNFVA